MPKFLEEDLRREATKKGLTGRQADRYVYGGMNNIGAMRGNQETAKGAAMERKHERDMAHPHRLAGTHDGMFVTEHHRLRPKTKY